MRIHSPKLCTMIFSCAIGILGFNSQAQALVWDWSYSGSGFSATGTFTTTGITPIAGQTYTIDSITGTTTRSADNVSPPDMVGVNVVSGLTLNSYADQRFQWDGTNKLLVTLDGIQYSTVLGGNYNIYSYNDVCPDPYCEPVGEIYNADSNRPITSSTLTPVNTTIVPFEVPSGSSIAVVGSIVGLSVMRKVRNYKKAQIVSKQFQKV